MEAIQQGLGGKDRVLESRIFELGSRKNMNLAQQDFHYPIVP
jgi:hypothetical protein